MPSLLPELRSDTCSETLVAMSRGKLRELLEHVAMHPLTNANAPLVLTDIYIYRW